MSEHPPIPAVPAHVKIEIKDLFNIEKWQNEIDWKPFHPGVEVFRLYGDGVNGPTAALLRYAKGAKIPSHLHVGYEHILVLSKTQRDEDEVYSEGSLLISPPKTKHSIVSDEGCIVLAIYEKPVEFFPTPQNPKPASS